MGKALFFNAIPDTTSETGYDRNYNADDLSDFLSIVCDTGVVKTGTVDAEPQGLKVVAASDMIINVNAGKAVIRGKAFINETLESFTISANGTAANRYDYIVIKYDNNVSARNITLELRTGTSSIPTVSALTRTDTVYELMLAYITVAPSATSIAQSNITDTRGDADLCPWFTAVKGYDDYYDAIVQAHESTVLYAANPVITDLPSSLYNERYSLIEVYTNGIKEAETAYTASVSGGYVVITFTTAKATGAKITVILNNFIDGEGMGTALAQYTELLEAVSDLQAAGEYNYVCNGVNDNVLISNLVTAYLNGGTDYGSAKFNIIGNIGMTSAASGTGESTNPAAWFDFTTSTEPTRKVIIDFSRAGAITPAISNGTYNIIFNGRYMTVRNATITANNTASGTIIKVFGAGYGTIKAVDCRFYITAYQDSTIAYCGTFEDCRGSIANSTGNTYCFLPNTNGLVRIIGGEYYAYTASYSGISAVLGQDGANAVSILYGVNAPTVSRSGYYQTNSIYQYSGGGMINCTDLVSVLPMSVISGLNNTRGTITKSKPGLM